MNKTIKLLTTIAAICTALILYIYTISIYPFAFNYETHLNGQYCAVFITVTGFTVIGILNIFRKEYNRTQYIGQIVVTLLLLVPGFSDKYSFGNEYWAVVCAIAILFTCLVFVPACIIVAFPYFLVLLMYWQLGLAFMQMDGFNLDAGKTNLQGSLQNSGVFSCYLAIHLPLLYWMAFQQPVLKPERAGIIFRWSKIIGFVISACFIAFIIYSSQSRSAIIGLIAAVISQFFFLQGRAIKAWFKRMPVQLKATFVSLIIISASGFAFYLFFLKKASAMGRAMKWEIASKHVGEHLISGTGIGRFSWNYPQWQAQYFAANQHPHEAYFLSAGESYIIFNEYLQLFETIGIAGFVLFLLLLYWFFTTSSHQYAQILSAIKVTMITLLATGLTTYVFHMNTIMVLMAICFAVALTITTEAPVRRKKILTPLLLFLLSTYITHTVYEKWKAVENWNMARQSPEISAGSLWEKSKNDLQTDGKFLTEYGRWLIENGNPKKAVTTLENAKKYFISRSTVEALAKAYERNGNYRKAIETRQWVSDYLPNKFMPKYELLRLYKLTGDSAGIKKISNQILNMPIKIPSAEVDIIIEEAKKSK